MDIKYEVTMLVIIVWQTLSLIDIVRLTLRVEKLERKSNNDQ